MIVHINFNNLDDKTQERLISMSKEEVENRFGDDLKRYAREHYTNYDALLEEEAIKNL